MADDWSGCRLESERKDRLAGGSALHFPNSWRLHSMYIASQTIRALNRRLSSPHNPKTSGTEQAKIIKNSITSLISHSYVCDFKSRQLPSTIK